MHCSWDAPAPSATYLWGGVARLDIEECPATTQLTFYGPPCLQVHSLPLLGTGEDVQAEDDGTAEALFAADAVAARGGLRIAKQVQSVCFIFRMCSVCPKLLVKHQNATLAAALYTRMTEAQGACLELGPGRGCSANLQVGTLLRPVGKLLYGP